MVRVGAGLCVVVHRDLGSSRGMKGCAGQAVAARISTYLIGSDEVRPLRLQAEDDRLR